MVLGNTMDSHKKFLDHLTISPKLCEVHSMKKADVIIAFVPIATRIGTDLSATIDEIPEGKPVVLVVLHHTFDENFMVPDVGRCVNRKAVFVVECLFHEDVGLLTCLQNDHAIASVKKHLIKQADLTVDCIVSGFVVFLLGFVVSVIIGVIVGSEVSVGAGVGVGFGVFLLFVLVFIIWVQFYRKPSARHRRPASCLLPPVHD